MGQAGWGSGSSCVLLSLLTTCAQPALEACLFAPPTFSQEGFLTHSAVIWPVLEQVKTPVSCIELPGFNSGLCCCLSFLLTDSGKCQWWHR